MHVHGPVSRTFSNIKYWEGAAEPSSLTDARIGSGGGGDPAQSEKHTMLQIPARTSW